MGQKAGSDSWRRAGVAAFVLGVLLLGALLLLLRFAIVTDYAYHSLVKDPERHPPEGNVIVAPADGTVLYVRPVRDGVIPEVVKLGVPVPMVEHTKQEPLRPFAAGTLIGIYMNTQGVHLNRMPNHGRVLRQTVWNGPHLDMTAAESRIILRQLLPGWVTLRKWLGLQPYGIESDADFVLKSARETLSIEDDRGAQLYLVRIADYYVGKILTWVGEGDPVARGEKIGMITWGSQSDLFIEHSDGLRVTARVGDYVYAGETVLATY